MVLERGLRVVVFSGVYRGVFDVLYADLDLVQAGTRVFWLKAEQIADVNVVGKIRHTVLEGPVRSEQFVFASGEPRNFFRSVLPHRLPGHDHESYGELRDIHALSFALRIAAQVVEKVGHRRRESQGVDRNVGVADRFYNVVDLQNAAMVSRLADEQQDTLPEF